MQDTGVSDAWDDLTSMSVTERETMMQWFEQFSGKYPIRFVRDSARSRPGRECCYQPPPSYRAYVEASWSSNTQKRQHLSQRSRQVSQGARRNSLRMSPVTDARWSSIGSCPGAVEDRAGLGSLEGYEQIPYGANVCNCLLTVCCKTRYFDPQC